MPLTDDRMTVAACAARAGDPEPVPALTRGG